MIATGMTLVLIIGGIDLSVGSVLGLCGTVLGVAVVTAHLPLCSAILLSLGVGLVAGTVNGLVSAVVIGGTSLLGGRGSVVNSFVGVLIIATLEAGLAQVGASEPAQRVITGVVIVGAVILDAWRHHDSGKRSPLLDRLFSRAQTR